ncbi:MAG: helix-turn-helix domain-containing protein [Actinomycetota bacterium]
MKGGELIREARRRSGLTQRELADRVGTTQPVIARWESGKRSPTYERLIEAVRACGLDLAVRIVGFDEGHDSLIDDSLRLTPDERLETLVRGQAAVQELVKSARRSESE